MSSLVEQIVQRLELLPDRVLRQVLEIVDLLGFSVSAASSQGNTGQKDDAVTGSPNLKKVGNVWIVKASLQSYDYENVSAFAVREERIEKITQW